jgi:hypothetical protein
MGGIADGPGEVEGRRVLFGPCDVVLGLDEFKQIYHAENDGFFRKIGLPGLFPAILIVPMFVYCCMDLFRGGPSLSDVLSLMVMLLFQLFVAWFVVCPPLPLKLSPRPFFISQGSRLARREEVNPCGLEVTVTVSVCRFGAQEVTADGGMVRIPFALMRRPVFTDGFMVLLFRDWKRTSYWWNSVFEADTAFRKDWNGLCVPVPLSVVGDRRAASRRVRALIRQDRRRWRRVRRVQRWWPDGPRSWDEVRRLAGPLGGWMSEMWDVREACDAAWESGSVREGRERVVPVRALHPWLQAFAGWLAGVLVRFRARARGGDRGPKRPGV